MKKTALRVISTVLIGGVCFFWVDLFAQESNVATSDTSTLATAISEETHWVWGEVTLVDTNLGQVALKYLDYETDEEKDVILIVDPTATFENVLGLKDIKTGDYASVDYITNKEGKNIAKNISVEKPETPSGETPVIQEEATGESKIPTAEPQEQE